MSRVISFLDKYFPKKFRVVLYQELNKDGSSDYRCKYSQHRFIAKWYSMKLDGSNIELKGFAYRFLWEVNRFVIIDKALEIKGGLLGLVTKKSDGSFEKAYVQYLLDELGDVNTTSVQRERCNELLDKFYKAQDKLVNRIKS